MTHFLFHFCFLSKFVKDKTLLIKTVAMNIKLPIKPLTLLISIMICTTLKGENLSEQNYFNRLANDGTSIWVATSNGVVRYDKTEKRAYNENEALEIDENSVINCIKTDKSGKVWYSVKTRVFTATTG